MKVYLFYILLFFIASCSTTKKNHTNKKDAPDSTTTHQEEKNKIDTSSTLEKNIDPKIQSILNTVANNELQFNFFYAKIKTKATLGNTKQTFTTQLRWHKNNKMWLSMSIIGIEGARALINHDSIKILDRLNQRNILKPISYLQSKAHINLTYLDIEKLFLGQPVFFNKNKLELTETPTENILKYNDERFNTIITLDKQHKIKNIFITDKLKNQTLLSEYNSYNLLNGKQFANERYIKIISGINTFELNMTFEDIDLGKNLSFPFEPNAKYSYE